MCQDTHDMPYIPSKPFTDLLYLQPCLLAKAKKPNRLFYKFVYATKR